MKLPKFSQPKAGAQGEDAVAAAAQNPKADSQAAGGEARAPAAPEQPRQDYYDQLLRLKAEFDNYRKRVDREKPDYFRRGKAELLLKFLPIYDLLRRAHEELRASHAQTELAKGMEMIFREFEKVFKEEGVRAMDPMGKPYDALAHEVLGIEEKAGAEDGQVVDVLQDGFYMEDKVLRSAKVRIAKKATLSPREGGPMPESGPVEGI